MSAGAQSLRNAALVMQHHINRQGPISARTVVSMDTTSSFGSTRVSTVPSSSSSSSGRRYARAASETDDAFHPFRSLFSMIDNGKTSLGTTTLYRPETRYLQCGVPEDALRFRTKHLGRLLEPPYIDGCEHKVTLVVPTYFLPLDEVERQVLQQIVGARLSKDRLQLSSNQFGSRIENKRHLISILDRVVLEAKKIAEEMKQNGATTTTDHGENSNNNNSNPQQQQ